MLKMIIAISMLLVTACSTQQKPPTPFEIGTKKIEIMGCEKLKREVEEWNKSNPNKTQKVADC